jgi:hypothetical protein
MSVGRELFLIVVAVVVILGPLITLAVFNCAKPARELKCDLTMVALLQLAALISRTWTVLVARPLHTVFKCDRFRVAHAVDVPVELLSRTQPGIVALPLTGPTPLSLRPFRDANEKMEATMASLEGLSLSARPDLWQPYAADKGEIWQAAKPATELKVRFASRSAEIDSAIAKTGRKPEALAYLPLVGRKSFWTVLLDPVTAKVLGFLPIDSF